jgi:hypothetical protein
MGHDVPKFRKGVGEKQNLKKCHQSTQLAERFKTSTILRGSVGFTHGRVANVLGIKL